MKWALVAVAGGIALGLAFATPGHQPFLSGIGGLVAGFAVSRAN